MSVHSQKYLSYLLRLWQMDQDGNKVWRASLEDPCTGERHGFATPELLIEFLLNLTQERDKERGNSMSSRMIE